MGLKLKSGNDVTESTGKINRGNSQDWHGVKKEGGAVNPYGVNRNDLSLNLFDGECEGNNTVTNDKVELKLTGVNEFNVEDNKDVEYDDSIIRNSISQAIDHRTYSSTVEEERGPLPIIMMIVAYVAIVVKLACIGWVCSKNAVDIIYNVTPLQWIINGISLIIIIDAIVVNVMHKKSFSLIVIALLFDFLYPLQRGKCTELGEMLGGVLTVTLFIAYGAFVLLVGKAVNNYGNIIQVEDEKVRTQAAAVLDQEVDGARLGNQIMQVFDIEEVAYGQQDGKDIVVLEGDGAVYLDKGNFVMQSYKDVETRLSFMKNSAAQYELIGVTLGDEKLTGQYLQFYWEGIMK